MESKLDQAAPTIPSQQQRLCYKRDVLKAHNYIQASQFLSLQSPNARVSGPLPEIIFPGKVEHEAKRTPKNCETCSS
jgi:hypothetical protein